MGNCQTILQQEDSRTAGGSRTRLPSNQSSPPNNTRKNKPVNSSRPVARKTDNKKPTTTTTNTNNSNNNNTSPTNKNNKIRSNEKLPEQPHNTNKQSPTATNPKVRGSRPKKVIPKTEPPKTWNQNKLKPTNGGIRRNNSGKKAAKVHHSTNCTSVDEDPFENADKNKFVCKQVKYNGSAQYTTLGKTEEIVGKSIQDGCVEVKYDPIKYVGIHYQDSMVSDNWPTAQHKYTLIHRKGTENYQPQGISKKGWMTIQLYEYQHLPPLKELPAKYRDAHTDTILSTFAGQRLQTVMPGRGMGFGDVANLKIIGDVDPSDISQGTVGNCWLLSGISALAEFDGGIKHLFRKTKGLQNMPTAPASTYIVTLWDLVTWKEVDIAIDERLSASTAMTGTLQLLASKISSDGELWVCYLEKALAVHCGGWDKLCGGQCTHAWSMLTGCRDQYTIRKNTSTGKYQCFSKYNSHKDTWVKHANSPHDCEASVWPTAWPAVGGDGSKAVTDIDQETLFQKMCAWDDQNYIVGASTDGSSDKQSTDGMVDNHAYSVIEAINDVAGTDIDLLKVRNPWGKGEIDDGEFDDDGPGWDRYPQIKAELNPVVADDGIFWVTKKEFFQYFGTIYLSASDMTEFLED